MLLILLLRIRGMLIDVQSSKQYLEYRPHACGIQHHEISE